MTTPPSPWATAPAGPLLLERPIALLHFRGPDALRVLHGQTSQDLQAARPGDWRSTCCLTPTARLRALAEVLVEEGGAWLALTGGDAAAQRLAFDRVLFPADQVELGPLQPGRWLRLVGLTASPEAATTWRPLEGGGGWWLGNDLVLAGDGATPDPFSALTPLDPTAAELWRLGAGEPAWPEEINDAFNPFELGLADRVSLQKGCYVGQETLAKLASKDGVKQQLRRWHGVVEPARAAPLEPGTPLQTLDGERAGQITSGLCLDGPVQAGLAMVRRQALGLDTLWAAVGEALVPVRLSRPTAFVDPPPPPGSGIGQGSGAA